MADRIKLADLPTEIIEKIKSVRFDQIIEKHEGPEQWSTQLEYINPDFMWIAGRNVLLPINKKRHPNVTILRTILSENNKMLTLFLKDTTYVSDTESEKWEAGRLAICEKMPDADFYIAVVYHEWFIVENEVLA